MTSSVERHSSYSAMGAAVDAVRDGRPVLIFDDMTREGEVVLAAQAVTPGRVGWMLRHSCGLLCAAMTAERADLLWLPPMVPPHQDPRGVGYTVTVDAREGITSGVSAADRVRTLKLLAAPSTASSDLLRPGHVLPVCARPGGLMERPGCTEAAVELCELAGVAKVAATAKLTDDDGSMASLDDVIELSRRFDLPLLTTAQLVNFTAESGGPAPRRPTSSWRRVTRGPETTLDTRYGRLRIIGYQDRLTGVDHIALVGGSVGDGAAVRVQSECLTGETFGSLRCDCGPQLDGALASIGADGGILIYLRGHEGRGIGLLPKLAAYELQASGGLDTVSANLQLGMPVDAREYGAAAAILRDLGISRIDLLTNNPSKLAGLRLAGLDIRRRIPLRVSANPYNLAYLTAKRERMGHLLDAGSLEPRTGPLVSPTAIDSDPPLLV